MELKFKNGKFVILQVSDAQDLQFARKTMLKMLNTAYDAVNPDLVVFTGDNILGNHLRDARFGSKKVIFSPDGEYEAMKKAIEHIARPVNDREIPFTMIYGNHDDMNFITKASQADIWRSYEHFTGLADSDESGDCDTFNLPILSSDGSRTAFNLWFMDSAWKDKVEDRCHTGVKKQAVDWYVKQSALLKEANGGKPVPSILFQHIPFTEAPRLTEECSPDSEGALAVEDKNGKIRYIRLIPSMASGFLGESVSGCEENYGEFDAIKACGDVVAAVFGHDHRNNFTGELDGIKIYQSSAASFRCYGNRLRGVRVIELDEQNPEKIVTYFLTFFDLCGSNLFTELAYIWDADGEEKKKAALIGGAGLAAACAVKSAIKRRKRRNI